MVRSRNSSPSAEIITAPPAEISATPPTAPTAHSTCRRVTFSCSTSTSIRMQHTGTTAMMVPATAEDVYRMP